MATITLKNVPEEIHEALKKQAERNGRSMNKEALACLLAAVAKANLDPSAQLADIRRHRESLPGRLENDWIQDAIASGRP